MPGTNGLRRLAVAAASLLQHQHYALALPQAPGVTVPAAAPAWVTVDPSGSASTIVPAIITTQGHRATILEPPENLLSTATYTLSPDGHASTYTGLAPVASATGQGDNPAGMFLACSMNQGVNEPFCLPKQGSTLHPGRTYYITWSPSYFSPPDLLSTHDHDGQQEEPHPSPFNITFLLSYDDPATQSDPNDRRTRTGPTVFVAPPPKEEEESSSSSSTTSSGGGRNAVAIAVPVAVAFALLVSAAVYFVSWRRHGRGAFVSAPVSLVRRWRRRAGREAGRWPASAQQRQQHWPDQHAPGGGGGFAAAPTRGGGGFAAAPTRGGGGHGGRYEADWDDKSETAVGIQLTDRDSWSPTGRRNVFREEVERQARLG